MKVVLAGGSGFLGRALRAALLADGHIVANLTRRQPTDAPEDVAWTPDGTANGWARVLDGVDAVVNLAGEGMADRRWSDSRKRAILSSRLLATRSLVAAITRAARPPRVFVSGSGVGYYGHRGDEIVTEATPGGTDFVADVCRQWEGEAERVSDRARLAIMRAGVVLHPRGGVLRRMSLPFKFGVGGPVGSGAQYLAWIHRDDWVDLMRWLIAEPEARGAFNVTSPEPVTNADFSRALGRALHRPAVMPIPAFGLRLIYGEMADMLLTGQRAIPARAIEMGFKFRFPTLSEALRDLFARN